MSMHCSFDTLVHDWEGLLNACDANAAVLPGLEELRDSLAADLAQAKALKAAQETMARNRQTITRHLMESCESGLESARRLRSLVKGYLGTKNEQLPKFGITPTGQR
jgi:predicted P-loop ATPase